jgi:hypothetical protein
MPLGLGWYPFNRGGVNFRIRLIVLGGKKRFPAFARNPTTITVLCVVESEKLLLTGWTISILLLEVTEFFLIIVTLKLEPTDQGANEYLSALDVVKGPGHHTHTPRPTPSTKIWEWVEQYLHDAHFTLSERQLFIIRGFRIHYTDNFLHL